MPRASEPGWGVLGGSPDLTQDFRRKTGASPASPTVAKATEMDTFEVSPSLVGLGARPPGPNVTASTST